MGTPGNTEAPSRRSIGLALFLKFRQCLQSLGHKKLKLRPGFSFKLRGKYEVRRAAANCFHYLINTLVSS